MLMEVTTIITGTLLTAATLGNWLNSRSKIAALELKVAELMKREEVILHVEKQINSVKELMAKDKEHTDKRLDLIHDDVKSLLICVRDKQ